MMKKITLSVRLLVGSKGQKHIFPTIVEEQYSILELEFIKTSERFSRVGNPNP